ncbi:class F sortase [Streptomyces sp. NPDC014006]|uniref:class F sortase n=1 Tax=Streptomyces sp. NPDC014006 TaxID=3364870 RepID=UPI0036F564EE
MVRPRRTRRPWYRTRAYRLARTAVLTVVLATVGIRCSGDDQSAAPTQAGAPGVVAVAGARPVGADAPHVDREGAGTARPRSSSAALQPRPRSSPPALRPRPSHKVARVRARPTPPTGPLPRSRPTTFRVPSLGIDAPVTGLRLDGDRELQTPPVDRPKLVGWYQGGPTPGEPGTAIAVGHRDTTKGPAVFAGLALVKPGRTIEVRRADGRTAVYTVDRVRVFDKSGFPDKEVYGPSRRPELRVITCGGLFSRRTGYTSNVVVFAHLTGIK